MILLLFVAVLLPVMILILFVIAPLPVMPRNISVPSVSLCIRCHIDIIIIYFMFAHVITCFHPLAAPTPRFFFMALSKARMQRKEYDGAQSKLPSSRYSRWAHTEDVLSNCLQCCGYRVAFLRKSHVGHDIPKHGFESTPKQGQQC